MARTVRYADPMVDWIGGFEPMTRDGVTRTKTYKGATSHKGAFYGEECYAPGAGKSLRRLEHRKGRQESRQELRQHLLV